MTRPRGPVLGTLAARAAVSDWERRTAVGGPVVDEADGWDVDEEPEEEEDEMPELVTNEWSPEKCACRWGEQPCWMCLPVLDARFKERIESERSGA